ncbi:MAG TPA: KpsF/GutQ family sugar-phosphate isomerase [Hyphomonadaceae bacterium]|nr:KpsF/GutQ family sugar-phosphate isomerase [Hyphomonadaceae bacterium]
MSEHPHIATARRVLALEADALGLMSRSLGDPFVKAVATILAARGRVICTGIGKSGHVARKIAATMASTGTQAYFVHATEASHGDLGMIAQDDVILALSKSGETKELADMIGYAKRYSIPLIGMTAKAESTLGRASDILLQVPDAAEACAETNAPTTSTTLMIALGDALAVALLESKGFKADHFKVFHPGGKLGAMLRTAADLMHKSAELPLVASGTPFIEAVKSMSGKGFGVLGVTSSDGKLAGIVTDGDLRRYLTSGKTAAVIDDVMNRTPLTAAPDQLAADVLRTMNERKITQIFVVENGAPAGIIHMHDLLKSGLA